MNLSGSITNLFKENPILALTLTGAMAIIVWLFKSFNQIQREDTLVKKEQLLKKITAYGILRAKLNSYLVTPNIENKEKLLLHIGESQPYLSTVQEKVFSYLDDLESENNNLLNTIHIEITNQLEHLQNIYDNEFQQLSRSTLSGFFNYYLSLLEKLVIPLLFTALTAFILLIFIDASITTTIKGDYSVPFSLFTTFLSIVLFINFIGLLERRNFKHTIRNWTICLSFGVLITFLNFYNSAIYTNIICISLILIFLFFVIPRIKRNQQI